MEIRKLLIGTTAIVIVILFMGMAMQPATTQSDQKTISVSEKQQIEYNRYFIRKPVNASDQFSNAFMSWYINRENANPYKGGHISNFYMNLNSSMKILISQFLSSDPSADALLKEITAQEKAKFAIQNNLVHNKFVSMLYSGKLNGTSKYVMQTGNSKYLFVKIDSSSPTPPSCVFSNPGIYQMVSINYFTFTISYWISIATVTYGEQDNFNTIYSGLPAENHYNKVTEGNTLTGIVGAAVEGALVGVVVGGPAGAAAGSLVGAIVAGVIGVLTSVVLNGEWKTIYESTYAGNAPGHQYISTVLVNVYYYPWVNPLTTMSSYFYFFGYLKGNGRQTIFPDLPTLVVYSQYLSDGANSFANSHGQNNLIYEGY